MNPIFLHAFCSFSHIDHGNRQSTFSPCLSYCLEQFPWVCPRGPKKKVLQKLNNSPPPRGKKYQYCTITTISTGFPWVSQGVYSVSAHGEGNDQCINVKRFSQQGRQIAEEKLACHVSVILLAPSFDSFLFIFAIS